MLNQVFLPIPTLDEAWPFTQITGSVVEVAMSSPIGLICVLDPQKILMQD